MSTLLFTNLSINRAMPLFIKYCIYVCVYFYILISPYLEFSRLHSLHPWYWNSLLCNFISSCENSVLFQHTIHHCPNFVQPGTHHCWVDRGGVIWEACPIPLHMVSSVSWAPVTHPSTNRAGRGLTFVIWEEVTTGPCATIKTPVIFFCKWTNQIVMEFSHDVEEINCTNCNVE